MKIKNLKEYNYPKPPKGKRLQNYKRCIGCNACYNLDVLVSKCEMCGCTKFIPDTDYCYDNEISISNDSTNKKRHG